MTDKAEISTGRLEAFSDGVIAILITVMVFNLKFSLASTKESIAANLFELLPKLLSYAVSYLMLAIMWVSHHQLFNQIKRVDNKLLWLNIHLLFWMSLIPFGTYSIGESPFLWQATSIYASIFLFTAFSFTLIRNHIVKANLLHHQSRKESHDRIKRKNRVAIVLYAVAGIGSLVTPFISYAIFLLVPGMYFFSTIKKNKD